MCVAPEPSFRRILEEVGKLAALPVKPDRLPAFPEHFRNHVCALEPQCQRVLIAIEHLVPAAR